jgi:hypothetical protein
MLGPEPGLGAIGGNIPGKLDPSPPPAPGAIGEIGCEPGGIGSGTGEAAPLPPAPKPAPDDGFIGMDGSIGVIGFGGVSGTLPGKVCVGPGSMIGPLRGGIMEGGGVVIVGEA